MARFRGRSRKPNLHWTGVRASTFGLAAGSVGLNMSVSAHATETLLRIRGNFAAFLDGLLGGGESILVSVGLHLVPEGTGTTVTVEPFGDPSYPWWYYATFVLAHEEYVNNVVYAPDMVSFREVIDVKAMRIIRPDQELQLVVENTTLLAAAPVNVTFEARVLSQD